MSALRVLVLEAQTPFVHGGAEILSRQLVSALRDHGHEADIVSLPFRDLPHDTLMSHAAAWRLVDVRLRGLECVAAARLADLKAIVTPDEKIGSRNSAALPSRA